MIRTVDAEQERTVAMLETWVNQNSGIAEPRRASRRSARCSAPSWSRSASRSSWIDMSEAGRAGHIVAAHKGNGRGKRMLLIGHLDTVFEPDSPFQRWGRKRR